MTYSCTLDMRHVVVLYQVDLYIHMLVHVGETQINVVPVPAHSIRRARKNTRMLIVRFGDGDHREKD